MMFLVLGETPADMPQAARIRLYVSNHEDGGASKIAAGARGEQAPLMQRVPAPLKLVTDTSTGKHYVGSAYGLGAFSDAGRRMPQAATAETPT